jgi:hypothetical protein
MGRAPAHDSLMFLLNFFDEPKRRMPVGEK